MTFAIVVHGGAGPWSEREERLDEALAACQAAAAAGRTILQDSGTALDAVEAAVRLLEDCPVLDAGRGSYLNAAGEVELDAMIMDGRSLAIGAVGAVQRVRNPISLARQLLTDSAHSFLVAAGAEAFADQIGFPRCAPDELVTPVELARHRKWLANQVPDGRAETATTLGDTVGAVAIDREGNVAAATSTGGTRHKRPGRIGDSPLVGSGGYADNWTGAAGATGHGEALMKVVISKRVCDFIAHGLSAQAACDAAIDVLHERVGGQGGVIAVDARGRVGACYNTGGMPHAHAVGDEEIVVAH